MEFPQEGGFHIFNKKHDYAKNEYKRFKHKIQNEYRILNSITKDEYMQFKNEGKEYYGSFY